jgi:hypothetical protein
MINGGVTLEGITLALLQVMLYADMLQHLYKLLCSLGP